MIASEKQIQYTCNMLVNYLIWQSCVSTIGNNYSSDKLSKLDLYNAYLHVVVQIDQTGYRPY